MNNKRPYSVSGEGVDDDGAGDSSLGLPPSSIRRLHEGPPAPPSLHHGGDGSRSEHTREEDYDPWGDEEDDQEEEKKRDEVGERPRMPTNNMMAMGCLPAFGWWWHDKGGCMHACLGVAS